MLLAETSLPTWKKILTYFRFLEDLSVRLVALKDLAVRGWTAIIEYANDTMSRYPLLAYGGSVAKKTLRVAHGLMEEYGLGTNLRSMMAKGLGQLESVCSFVSRLIDVVVHNEALVSYDLSVDLDAGHVTYTQLLPFHWYSFLEVPDIVKATELLNSMDQSSQPLLDFQSLQHDVVELMGSMSHAIGTKHVIPPFSATALLAGDSHVITFDQKFYDFSAGASGCSYLLASDFSRGRFSAIAKYDQDGRRTSVDIIVDGRTITIHTGSSQENSNVIKVTLDKRTIQLPLAFDRTYAYRKEGVVVVEHSEGFSVSCNAAYNVCSFTISGWHFGKTGGLLGTYDNEPANDWMTPHRKVVSSLGDFASSWSLNGCSHVVPEEPEDDQVAAALFSAANGEVEACGSTFVSNDSALMPCFSAVDPGPFLQMCLTDMRLSKNKADKRSGVCPAAAAYIHQCRQYGVELWMPGLCVQCRLHQELLRNGESSIFQDNSPRSADVVFIVQQGKCLAEASLDDLPQLIDRSFTSKGISDNRFGLVGFDGVNQLERPHVFTSGSQIFSDAAKISFSE